MPSQSPQTRARAPLQLNQSCAKPFWLGQCQALIGSGLVYQNNHSGKVEYIPVILSKGIIKILSRTILSCALVANLMATFSISSTTILWQQCIPVIGVWPQMPTSRSKCKHFLRVCQPKEGLTLLSFPQRVEPKDRSHQRADTGIHNEDNSNLYNSPISKGWLIKGLE